MSHITLPRAVVEQVREALESYRGQVNIHGDSPAADVCTILDAALAEPEPVVVEQLFVLAKLTVRRAADPDPWVWDRLEDDGTWTPFNPLIHGPDMWRLEQALRAALAEPEPTGKDSLQVDAERYRWLRGELHGFRPPLARVVWKRHNIRESGDWTDLSDGQTLDEHIDAALAEPPATREPTHPGYVIGAHWLETTYSRIAAGEAEDAVLAEVLGARGWAKPEPATMEQIVYAHRCSDYDGWQFHDGWREAERFHGIKTEDGE